MTFNFVFYKKNVLNLLYILNLNYHTRIELCLGTCVDFNNNFLILGYFLNVLWHLQNEFNKNHKEIFDHHFI